MLRRRAPCQGAAESCARVGSLSTTELLSASARRLPCAQEGAAQAERAVSPLGQRIAGWFMPWRERVHTEVGGRQDMMPALLAVCLSQPASWWGVLDRCGDVRATALWRAKRPPPAGWGRTNRLPLPPHTGSPRAFGAGALCGAPPRAGAQVRGRCSQAPAAPTAKDGRGCCLSRTAGSRTPSKFKAKLKVYRDKAPLV